MGFTDKQNEVLLNAIHPNRVNKDGKGHSHVEAWDVRRYLNRIFGFGNWCLESRGTDLISHVATPAANPNQKGAKDRHTVIYRATVRLTIKDPDGNVMAFYDGVATGDATNQPSLADAHDLAIKTADSQALKRAAMNLGDQFGLSLYDKGSDDPVGLWTLVPEIQPVAVKDIVDSKEVHAGDDSPLAAEDEPEVIAVEPAPVLVREPAVKRPTASVGLRASNVTPVAQKAMNAVRASKTHRDLESVVERLETVREKMTSKEYQAIKTHAEKVKTKLDKEYENA